MQYNVCMSEFDELIKQLTKIADALERISPPKQEVSSLRRIFEETKEGRHIAKLLEESFPYAPGGGTRTYRPRVVDRESFPFPGNTHQDENNFPNCYY